MALAHAGEEDPCGLPQRRKNLLKGARGPSGPFACPQLPPRRRLQLSGSRVSNQPTCALQETPLRNHRLGGDHALRWHTV